MMRTLSKKELEFVQEDETKQQINSVVVSLWREGKKVSEFKHICFDGLSYDVNTFHAGKISYKYAPKCQPVLSAAERKRFVRDMKSAGFLPKTTSIRSVFLPAIMDSRAKYVYLSIYRWMCEECGIVKAYLKLRSMGVRPLEAMVFSHGLMLAGGSGHSFLPPSYGSNIGISVLWAARKLMDGVKNRNLPPKNSREQFGADNVVYEWMEGSTGKVFFNPFDAEGIDKALSKPTAKAAEEEYDLHINAQRN